MSNRKAADLNNNIPWEEDPKLAHLIDPNYYKQAQRSYYNPCISPRAYIVIGNREWKSKGAAEKKGEW